MNDIRKLPKIIRRCMTIGMLPSSYKQSLTYEEQLLWFCDFLENQVIPVVNNNSEVVEELKNYFENLDVQEEINNKLDEMAESGKLTDIIAQYLQLAGLLCFNTKSDLKNAQNLSNGSFTKTFGDTLYNDGQGQFYKIRTLTSSDVVDDVNILALSNFPSLIAELIENFDINQLRQDVEDINDNIVDINDNIEQLEQEIQEIAGGSNFGKTIIIGDSYSLDRRPSINITGWAVPLKGLLNLDDADCTILQDDGGGFVASGTLGTFLQAITNAVITDKNSIKNIVVCGGLNDIQASNKSAIKTAIQSFMNYCLTNFPNAKVSIGMIGWTKDSTSPATDHQYERYQVLEKVLPAYQECSQYKGIYLNGVENIMHDTTLYYDLSHPNQSMCDKLAYYIYQALKNGFCSVSYDDHNLTFKNNNISLSYFSLIEKILNNNTLIFDNNEYGSQIDYTSNYPTVDGAYRLYVGELDTKYFQSSYSNQELFTCPTLIKDTANRVYQVTASFYLKDYNYLYCHIVSTEIQEGLSVKQLTLFNPYGVKPTALL